MNQWKEALVGLSRVSAAQHASLAKLGSGSHATKQSDTISRFQLQPLTEWMGHTHTPHACHAKGSQCTGGMLALFRGWVPLGPAATCSSACHGRHSV